MWNGTTQYGFMIGCLVGVIDVQGLLGILPWPWVNVHMQGPGGPNLQISQGGGGFFHQEYGGE